MNLTNFRGMPNSIRILYKISLLIESCAFLKSTNSWCTASLYSHFFSSIWLMQNIWSLVDPLLQHPHWWSPIISSAYGVNVERRMFDRILYVSDHIIHSSSQHSLATVMLTVEQSGSSITSLRNIYCVVCTFLASVNECFWIGQQMLDICMCSASCFTALLVVMRKFCGLRIPFLEG
jgi:hypothetical protein